MDSYVQTSFGVDLRITIILSKKSYLWSLMSSLEDQISSTQAQIDNYSIQNAEEAEAFRIKFLGSKGSIKELMMQMKDVPKEEKKEMGQRLNALKKSAEDKLNTALSSTTTKAEKQSIEYDWTLPADQDFAGSIHPLNLVHDKIVEIFSYIGFSVEEGPEIEDDWHNFTALNLPADHPARDMQDTFFISQDPDWVLRTHTSNVQIRTMETESPPIRKIFPGRVYRNETISARAHCFFHQVEGLYISEKVSFQDLKQTLYYFVKEMFGEDVKVRFRPSYFPFTEPSAEMDISCLICGGEGCSVCKQTGWVEILGCGMVHPNVLKNCNIDTEKYNGFAFGMGIERITMLKFGIDDLRLFSENDRRFLSQFRGLQI